MVDMSADELQKELCQLLKKNHPSLNEVIRYLEQPGLFGAEGFSEYLKTHEPALTKVLTKSELNDYIQHQLKYVKTLWILMNIFQRFPTLFSVTPNEFTNHFDQLALFCAQKTENIHAMFKQKLTVKNPSVFGAYYQPSKKRKAEAEHTRKEPKKPKMKRTR